MGEEEKVDETILELTDIFNDLTTNAIGLSKDLVVGIDAVHQISYAWFIGAFVLYLFGNSYGWSTNIIGITVGMVVLGILNFWRFRKLKSKYTQIYQLRKQMETM